MGWSWGFDDKIPSRKEIRNSIIELVKTLLEEISKGDIDLDNPWISSGRLKVGKYGKRWYVDLDGNWDLDAEELMVELL